jgi:hypothetical protein
MKKNYKGRERRQFVRLDYTTPLAYKVCKKKTVSMLLEGYTTNISQAGLLCNIKDKVKKGDLLWLSFDRGTLSVCEGLEKRSLIYQNGVIGKVARIERKKDDTFNVGIQFITREEKNLSNIYPKIYFLKDKSASLIEEPEEEIEPEELQLDEEELEQESLEEEREQDSQ